MSAPTTARPFGPQLNDWLEARLTEPLPPCEVQELRGFVPPGAWPDPPPKCGRPAVAVVTLVCAAACRPPWRRSACGWHRHGFTQSRARTCGWCGAEIRIGGLS